MYEKPASEYITRTKAGVTISKYLLRSRDADRTIIRVGAFPKGVWKEVPYETWASLKDAPGWEGKVETTRSQGGLK